MFQQLNGVEIFFIICAVIGGTFVLIRLILQFIGADMDTDIDGSGIDLHHTDSDAGFQVLSLHGFTSFLMMFGLVGFAVYRDGTAGIAIAIVSAMAAGVISVWIMAKMFNFINRLQSDGTLRIEQAVGSNGSVYLTIPVGGTGRVTINFSGRLREMDAVSADNQEMKTGEGIRVTGVRGNALVVERNLG